MYIGDYLGKRALYSPDRVAIVDAGKNPALRLNYRELNLRSNRLANWLRDTAGVRKKKKIVSRDIEFFSYTRALRSIRRADRAVSAAGGAGSW